MPNGRTLQNCSTSGHSDDRKHPKANARIKEALLIQRTEKASCVHAFFEHLLRGSLACCQNDVWPAFFLAIFLNADRLFCVHIPAFGGPVQSEWIWPLCSLTSSRLISERELIWRAIAEASTGTFLDSNSEL